jgi:sugar phosphate isomerase/epimerase
MGNVPVALGLWTVRDEWTRDAAGTLRAIAESGYAGIEHVHGIGYGMEPRALKRLLDDLSLRQAGNHVALRALENELDRVIEINLELENRTVICAWLEEAHRRDRDSFLRVAESLQQIGERCRAAGLRFGYHNHDFEFVRFDGQYGLELLCEKVSPGLMHLQLDVHWLTRIGEDAPAYVRAHADRVLSVHFKDLSPGMQFVKDHADPRPFTEVGSGVVDFRAVAEAASSAAWFIVEQDYMSLPSLESARTSLQNLRRLKIA